MYRHGFGQSYDGSKTYRLTVPPNVPIEQYWSVTAYDRQTHALIRKMARPSRSSQIPEVQKNADGSVDVYFGPNAPQGAGRKTRCPPIGASFLLTIASSVALVRAPKF